jgi:hypothetical protein
VLATDIGGHSGLSSRVPPCRRARTVLQEVYVRRLTFALAILALGVAGCTSERVPVNHAVPGSDTDHRVEQINSTRSPGSRPDY